MTDKPTEQAVVADRWDREDLKRMLKGMSTLRAARTKLGAFAPTGAEALNDTFWALHQAVPTLRDPAEMEPSHRVNRAIMEALAELPDTQRLRNWTVGDDVQTTMACVSIEPDLETLFDRFAQQSKQAQQLQEMVIQLERARGEAEDAEQDLDEMVARWLADDGDEEQAALDQAAHTLVGAEGEVAELMAQADELSDELDAGIATQMATLASMVRDAVGHACQEFVDLAASATAWGVEPGELRRLSAKERLALARKLNSPRIREISRIFGRIQAMVMSDYVRVSEAPHEIYELEFGNDLARLAPSELLNLCDPMTENEFLRRFSERALLQYSMEGEETAGRGGIVLCEDGSYSMQGERERWAKAVMLMLLNVAKEQKREMHVLHFGAPGQIRVLAFTRPEDFTFERIIEAAELFWASGTDFVTPMACALEVLGAEHSATGSVRADVVFITDDECGVPDPFMHHYLAEMHRMQATTWGVMATGRRPSPTDALYRMSEGKVALVKDFASGIDVREVFRGAA